MWKTSGFAGKRSYSGFSTSMLCCRKVIVNTYHQGLAPQNFAGDHHPFCQVSAVPFTRGVFAPQGVVGAITSSANEIGGGRVDLVHLSTII